MNEQFVKSTRRVLLALGLLGAGVAWGGPSEVYWHEDASRNLSADAPHPAEFRALSLETSEVAGYLRDAHQRGIAVEIALPQPEGGFADFMVVDSGTLPPELQRKYPDILSFKGSDAKGRPVRLDVSPMGFQAMVFDPAGMWVVRPEVPGAGTNYLSYKRGELATPEGMGRCEVHDRAIGATGNDLLPTQPMTQTGINHRTYRAAVAANHQYIAAVGGGTVAGGLAATVVAVNRVTQIYESEMAIQLVLVANNDLLMYASASGDPFTANDGSFLNSATGTISGVVGSGNYDIGHVFTTGSGGVAGLGVVCSSSQKGRGTTGMPNPIGDDFYVDYVAHEMGHQFGGNHTFNSSTSNCGGGNRNGGTAYEPGSGSTIMAYAGICGADDLQPHSDPYFHAVSLQEITNFTNGSGGSCAVNTTNDNHAPVIDAGSLPTGYSIPKSTPFVLSATATDADAGDTVKYSWEEWDLGASTTLVAADNGASPLFRAWPATTSNARMFPKLSTVLTGVALKGEKLPTVARTAMKFRLTARDEHAGKGASTSADVSVAVVATAGPFQVTAPNSAVTWAQGSTQNVTWDVANTTAAPISCATVDIDLSTDGGQTFPASLASGVANSGSASVTVPAVTTTQARVGVSCASNIFFDISNANFTISAASGNYTVGGNVNGLVGSGLVLSLNAGAQTLAVPASGAFTFPTALPNGSTYAVTVGTQPSGQSCAVANGSGQLSGANVTNVAVTCSSTNFTVGGNVSGLSGSGLVLSLNAGAQTLPVSVNGNFAFPTSLANGTNYTVTVGTQPAGQVCSVANGTGQISGANVTSVAVACQSVYTVGGSVSGLAGTGLVLSLDAGAQSLPVSANGGFTFPVALANGVNYAVTVGTQPGGQTCSVGNGTGQISGANVTNVAVTCVSPTFTVGGTVNGLTGSGLVLSLNGGAQSLPVAATGGFTFPTALANGAAYAVTVGTQPSGQSCSVGNGSGTIAGANVGNIIVTCALDDTIFRNGFDGSAVYVQPLQDPGFEATTADAGSNPSWEGADTNPGAGAGDTNFYSDLGQFTGLPVHAGHWTTWFGGWGGGAEVQHVAQSVTVTSGGPRYLNFWRFLQALPDAAGTLTVSIDGTAIDTLDVSTATVDTDFVQRSLDISAYADGGAHVIRFEYVYGDAGATGVDGQIFIDDVTVDETPVSPRHAAPSVHKANVVLRKHAR
ncbi:reprolysin-like metallopeptidase [Dokdonella sp.]|uniref:reprolysin-like metallopeptidase n=1 Tax=Dokdonella sp. TaxID=2291710 RepID=UPI003783E982